MQNEELSTFRRKGIWVFHLSLLYLRFQQSLVGLCLNYENSVKDLTSALAKVQEESKQLTLDGCADKTMEWFKQCDSMAQIM